MPRLPARGRGKNWNQRTAIRFTAVDHVEIIFQKVGRHATLAWQMGDVVKREKFSNFLVALEDCPPLRDRVSAVLLSLPEEVQQDFLDDPAFRIDLEDIAPGRGSRTFLALPISCASVSRSVVLRRKLATSSEAFAHYIIAHELAHAFLRNGGWQEIVDREEAADALALTWGYPRPGTDYARIGMPGAK